MTNDMFGIKVTIELSNMGCHILMDDAFSGLAGSEISISYKICKP